jgi:hypothetical protein
MLKNLIPYFFVCNLKFKKKSYIVENLNKEEIILVPLPFYAGFTFRP